MGVECWGTAPYQGLDYVESKLVNTRSPNKQIHEHKSRRQTCKIGLSLVRVNRAKLYGAQARH
jgi:hypothetical protein